MNSQTRPHCRCGTSFTENTCCGGTVSGTAAMGGTGKSAKAIVEALSMASGKRLLNEQPPRQLHVLLINLEDNRNAVNKRIAAAMKHYHDLIKPKDIGNRLFTKAKGEFK